MTIGHTETRNKYDRPHSNLDWVGISGATRSQWGSILRNKGIPLNSLRAGVYIFKYYTKQCNGDLLCAAKKYKGIQSSKTEHLAHTLINTYREILALEKTREKELNKQKPKRITDGKQWNKNTRVTKVTRNNWNKNSKTNSGRK